MSLKKIRVLTAVLAGTVLASGTLLAEQDTNQALLNLLVKKGILSQQDVATLQQELAAQPAPAAAPMSAPASAPVPAGAVSSASTGTSPLFFKIGNANFTPFGFMDFTGVYRSTATGSAIGSGFNSIPFSNGNTGQLSETKFSAQNSRLGLRVDSDVQGSKVLGYLETDFLGNAPTNLGVSSNSDTLRMRVYFLDLKKGDFEFLAGQDWSMLTPNRRGISPIPGDIFFSNDVDTNYQEGLTWARQPQFRVLYHASDELTFGGSLENPDQYVGSAVSLPTGFNAAEVDQGSSTSQPNLFPDVIGKVAYDTKDVNGLPWHVEVGGLVRTFKINTYSATVSSDKTTEGTGATVGVSLDIVKGLTFIGTGFYSYGGGRYINGLGPDFIVTAPDQTGTYGIGLVKASSAILGLEYSVLPNDLVSVYYSTVAFGERSTTNTNGTLAGYGYVGSANSNNKSIDEFTLVNNYTFWKNPAYGALNLMAQVSYVDRTPWYVAAGAPSKAKTTMVYLNVRYTLP